ncbi:MAG: chemotaxis protein CheW [Clostridia bacterium]
MSTSVNTPAGAASLRTETGEDHAQGVSATRHVVVFQLSRELYAVGISDVREIVRMQPITPVPSAPDYVEGVVNLRGQVIPVLSLAKRLGVPAEPVTPSTRIVVVQAGQDTIGMIVDSVVKVSHIPEQDIERPEALAREGAGLAYIVGIARAEDSLITLIDLEQALSFASTPGQAQRSQ